MFAQGEKTNTNQKKVWTRLDLKTGYKEWRFHLTNLVLWLNLFDTRVYQFRPFVILSTHQGRENTLSKSFIEPFPLINTRQPVVASTRFSELPLGPRSLPTKLNWKYFIKWIPNCESRRMTPREFYVKKPCTVLDVIFLLSDIW